MIRRRSRSGSPEVAPGSGPILQVEHLSVELHTASGRTVRPVDDVSFELGVDETLGIVGESGSGKSILLRALMGLLPARTTEISGRVRFQGRDLVGMHPRQLRQLWGQGMSLVLQDPLTALNPVLRIERQVVEALRPEERARKDAPARAAELLRLVGISEPDRRLRQYPHELSGGMRQRVAIAIALAGRPALLLGDEPTTALDVTVQARILDLLGDIQERTRTSVVLVSHDLGVVASRTDHVMVMYAGQVVERGPTASLFRSTRTPYTEALLQSIPRLDAPPHARLATIGGRPPSVLGDQVGCRFAPRCRYAEARCRSEVPPLRGAEDGHDYRCWLPLHLSDPHAAAVALRA